MIKENDMKPIRIFILLAVALIGYRAGGISGVFWLILTFCFGCFLWYTITDGMKSLGNFMRPTQNNSVTINVNDGSSIKGHPDIEGRVVKHGDPTRPTDEDFAGLLTARFEGRRNG
jgi:hypothetical protein